MKTFDIHVVRQTSQGLDAPLPLKISAADSVFTRLLRPGSADADDYLVAPPSQLAFWLADNWWRLRWESAPSGWRTADWRLAHELASIGGGYVWPRLTVWGEGAMVGLSSKSDAAGVVGPVRYLTDDNTLIDGRQFERAVDSFFDAACDDESGIGTDRLALKAIVDQIREERANEEWFSWRQLEARAGFDRDQAPEQLMNDLSAMVDRFGQAGVDEAVQANPGNDAAIVLSSEIAAARTHGLTCNFRSAAKESGAVVGRNSEAPWQAGEMAAKRVRDTLGLTSEPLSNRRISELCTLDFQALESTDPAENSLSYGLRLTDLHQDVERLAIRSRRPVGRRFEICRALGDAIWSADDVLGPIARSKTPRQKFQRAFAQSLLCPFDHLMSYINNEQPSDEDVDAAARHFDVSTMMVQSLLVNRDVVGRNRFAEIMD